MDNNILPTDEYVTFEDRVYLNPNLAVTETNQFIDNLRNTQQVNNAQINQQTQRLGTNVPSDMGGLTGAQSYWTSRYQTPQTNSAVADLRATAQATALNQILANEKAKWQKRYTDAYNAYQRRAWNKQNPSSGGSGLDIDTNDTSKKKQIKYYTNGEYEQGKLYPVTDYVSDYQDASGQWWQVSNPTQVDMVVGPSNNSLMYKKTNENVVTINGQDYIYLDNVPNTDPSWYRATRSAGPNTYSPYAGS